MEFLSDTESGEYCLIVFFVLFISKLKGVLMSINSIQGSQGFFSADPFKMQAIQQALKDVTAALNTVHPDVKQLDNDFQNLAQVYNIGFGAGGSSPFQGILPMVSDPNLSMIFNLCLGSGMLEQGPNGMLITALKPNPSSSFLSLLQTALKNLQADPPDSVSLTQWGPPPSGTPPCPALPNLLSLIKEDPNMLYNTFSFNRISLATISDNIKMFLCQANPEELENDQALQTAYDAIFLDMQNNFPITEAQCNTFSVLVTQFVANNPSNPSLNGGS